MPIRFSSLIAMTTILVVAGVDGTCAHPSRWRRERHPAPPPSITDDALELGILAPPSSASTFAETYGDAGIARRQFASRRAARIAPAPYPCDPRQARAGGYVCENVPPRLGYGQFYAFTPSAVSAPQSFAVDPGAQTPLLAPVTSLFLGANGLRFDPHN